MLGVLKVVRLVCLCINYTLYLVVVHISVCFVLYHFPEVSMFPRRAED